MPIESQQHLPQKANQYGQKCGCGCILEIDVMARRSNRIKSLKHIVWARFGVANKPVFKLLNSNLERAVMNLLKSNRALSIRSATSRLLVYVAIVSLIVFQFGPSIYGSSFTAANASTISVVSCQPCFPLEEDSDPPKEGPCLLGDVNG